MTPSTTSPATAQLAARLRVVIARLSRKLRQQAAAEPGEITASQLAALGSVDRLGPVTLGDLAAVEQVQPPSMTRIVGRLEELGLTDRQVDPGDRRVARVSVTEEGRRFLARSRTRKDAYLSRRLDSLSEEERQELDRALVILDRLLGEDR